MGLSLTAKWRRADERVCCWYQDAGGLNKQGDLPRRFWRSGAADTIRTWGLRFRRPFKHHMVVSSRRFSGEKNSGIDTVPAMVPRNRPQPPWLSRSAAKRPSVSGGGSSSFARSQVN